MPTIKDNLRIWDSTEHWEKGIYGNHVGLEDGEKWSKAWGSSDRQWQISLLPRIQKYLPTGVILEIGPGRGRWTRFLKDLCKKLIIVDLSANCIEYCKSRFSNSFANITYIVNDGKTLPNIEDNSVDFVFSFDSMVHVDLRDLEAYISETARVLNNKGVSFIHHSNLGEYDGNIKSSKHMRAENVSGTQIKKACERNEMYIVSQEYIPWTSDNVKEKVYLDCISIFTKNESIANPDKIIKNNKFLLEQIKAKKLNNSSKNRTFRGRD